MSSERLRPDPEKGLNCVMRAWHRHEAELHAWLRGRVGSPHDVDDLLQDLFLKAMRQGRKFCEIDNARAWLFEVARNALADRTRLRRNEIELPEALAAESAEPDAIDSMAACLPRALAEMSAEDRDALTLCDLGDMSQADYANLRGLSLPAAKSRIQRARKRLRAHLSRVCQVRFDPAGKVCCFVPRASR